MRLFLLSSLLLGWVVGCGGGGDSFSVSNSATPQGGLSQTAAIIAGTWRNFECTVVASNSEIDEFVSDGSTFSLSKITFFNNTECSGNQTTTDTLEGSLNFPNLPISNGFALDMVFERGRRTASDATIALLAAQGTTLADVGAAQGISDINNIPINDDGSSRTVYTIFAVNSDQLLFGGDTPSFDGLTVEGRHNTFGPDVFTRTSPAPQETITAPVNDTGPSNDAQGSRVIGIAFDQGEPETFFDPGTQLLLTRLEGEGTYVVLDDGTAILSDAAPADLNPGDLSGAEEVTTLQALGIPQSDVYPPLPEGFTLDFTGESNKAGLNGVELRSILFISNGTFNLSSGALTTIDVIGGQTSGNFGSNEGTYSVSGNTIELRFFDGNFIRTAFGSNSSGEVVVGSVRYR